MGQAALGTVSKNSSWIGAIPTLITNILMVLTFPTVEGLESLENSQLFLSISDWKQYH